MKKAIVITVSVLLILLILACCLIGYEDLLPGKLVSPDMVTIDARGGMSIVKCTNYLIHANGLGTVMVARLKNDEVITSWRGVYLDRPATHLSMLSLRKGMTLSEVVAVVGMPYLPGGNEGFPAMMYKTSDNCYYNLHFGFDGKEATLGEITILMAGEKEWRNFRGLNSFHWKIRFHYIGLAAILGIVLVALLTVPNAIRKRKAKSV